MVTVLTGTSTKVMGLWHLAATVTVVGFDSAGSSKRTTPVASVCLMSAEATLDPAMTYEAGMGSPV